MEYGDRRISYESSDIVSSVWECTGMRRGRAGRGTVRVNEPACYYHQLDTNNRIYVRMVDQQKCIIINPLRTKQMGT
jgi:hypothetical protein